MDGVARLGLAVMVLVGCAGSAGPTPSRPAPPATPRASSCASDETEIREIDLPRFVLADGAMADWLGEDIVALRVGPLVTANEPPPFEGAIYETCASRWTAVAPPPPIPGGTGMSYRMRAVGGRVVLLYYGQAVGGAYERGALVYDPGSRAWAAVDSSGAPDVAAFLTGPYREVTIGDRWVWFPHGAPRAYVLDVSRARWIPASTRGMPSAPNTFFLRALPSGLVLVPDAREDVAGLFDPLENAWRSIPFVRLDADYHSVALAPSGEIAVLSWDPPSDGVRTVRAWIVDPSARTVTRLPPTTTSASPNAAFTTFDGERIVHLDVDRWHRFERGRWTDGRLPLPSGLRAGGSFRPVSAGRAHIVADHHWIVDLSTMSFRRVAWREDIPALGHLTLYDEHRIAILGEVREEVTPRSCPPGAPCLPPERERVEVPRAFLVPLRGS